MIRILIVDDQKVVREKLRYMLEQADDMKVVGIATDGNIALEQIEVFKPDIVLIDIEMPNMDGIDATKIISRKFPDIKVMVLSTFDSEEYVDRSINAGAKGYLLKSLSTDELQNSVRFIYQGYAQLIGPGLKKQQVVSVNANGTRAVTSNPTKDRKLQFEELKDLDIGLNRQPSMGSTNGSIITKNESWQQPTPKKINWKKWLGGWAVVNVCVWSLALLYIKSKAPIYTSEWSLILPGEAKVDLNLPQVGKAKFSVDNTVEDLDPRNNILYLANSSSVLSKAAKMVGVSSDDFGEPEIEIVDDSSIISFSIDGDSPEEAQSKALAVHQSKLQQIEFLKSDRSKKQSEDFRSKIKTEQSKLQEFQQRLHQRKIDSDLIAPDKVSDLAARIEDLREEQNQTERDLREAESSIQLLSSSLNLSPEQADDALNLQGDRLFQQYLQDYNGINANLVALQAKFTDNAPVVVNEQEKLQQVEAALKERGSFVLSKPIAISSLEQLNLKSSSDNKDRETMARQLIAARQSRQNFNVKSQTLDKQIQKLNYHLKYLAQEKLPLENLEREAEFAEAVLTSKIAQSGIQDDSSNFPVIQLLSEPDLPDEPSNSDMTASLVSTAAFSFLSLTGLMLLLSEKNNSWQDDYLDSQTSSVNQNLLNN
ncbi:MAG: response regulator [Pleurocapsa sp.]